MRQPQLKEQFFLHSFGHGLKMAPSFPKALELNFWNSELRWIIDQLKFL
jgi:hypothetical protein